MLMCQFHLSTFIMIIIYFCGNSVTSDVLDSQKNHVDIVTVDSVSQNGVQNTTLTRNGSGISEDHTLAEESRGWKKTALPFLLGITLKMTTLLPMISSLMTVIGGVALVASKLALVISIGLAVHYYMISKHQIPSYSSFYRQPIGHYESVLPVTPYPVTHRLSVQSTSRNVR